MRFLLFALALVARAQDFRFTPTAVRQGQTLILHASKEAAKARMNGVTIPLFPEADGTTSGLMPVGVEEEPDDYPLEFLNDAGAVVHATTVTVHDAHYPKQDIVIAQALS